MNLLQQLEQEQVDKLAASRPVPEFQPGDTLRVGVKVVEGERERIQIFEGVCIGRKNAGVNSDFTLRKISYDEGVERIFPLYSPRITSIDVRLVDAWMDWYCGRHPDACAGGAVQALIKEFAAWR